MVRFRGCAEGTDMSSLKMDVDTDVGSVGIGRENDDEELLPNTRGVVRMGLVDGGRSSRNVAEDDDEPAS